jgi:hypothetical protein
MRAQIVLHAVVVEQRVVAIEQEHDVIGRVQTAISSVANTDTVPLWQFARQGALRRARPRSYSAMGPATTASPRVRITIITRLFTALKRVTTTGHRNRQDSPVAAPRS